MFSPGFDEIKIKLYRQYADKKFNRATGVEIPELKLSINDYINRNKEKPHMQVKAGIFKIILSNAQIAVDDFDFFADRLNHGDLMKGVIERWRKEAFEALPDAELKKTMTDASKIGIYNVQLDLGHTSPDWYNILSLGVQGLKQRASDKLGTGENPDFLNAVVTVYDAISGLMLRLADEAAKYGTLRMGFVADDLRHLAFRPPETFHQALQLAYIYHEIQELEGENVRSMAGFDRLYYRFYKSDIDRGIITKEQAKELIKYFFYKFMSKTQGMAAGKNFYFSGVDAEGSDCTNELSFLTLEAYDEMNVVDPKLTVRVGPDTPQPFIRKAVECIRKGNNSIVFVNDEIAVKMLTKQGKSLEDARNYTIIGCYEPAVMGKEISCTMAITFNLAKIAELALFGGIDPHTGINAGLPAERSGKSERSEYPEFMDFYNEYIRHLDWHAHKAMEAAKLLETKWEYVNPSPVLSGTFDSCMEKSLDISEYGAKYNNSGFTCGCLASAADSLSAVRELVYDKKRYTLREVRDAVRNNWQGCGDIHLNAMKTEKWGNNKQGPDSIGEMLSSHLAGIINGKENNRGGHFQLALFSIDLNFHYGRKTGALPDGHIAGMPLSKNLGAVTAMDREGITALINSVTKIDFTDVPNGSVLDIVLHPSSVHGEDGLNAFISFIHTFFRKGGFAAHFNIFDGKTLLDAQNHPEMYQTLQVRVCGWNSYFVNLSRESQNEFIRTACNI